MNILFLPDLSALLMLVVVLAMLQRRHPDHRGKVWLAGLFFTLVEAVAHTFYARDGVPAEALHVTVLDCYLTSGLIFFWAASGWVLQEPKGRRRLAELAMYALPLFAIDTMYGLHVQWLRPYVAVAAVGGMATVLSLVVFGRAWREVLLLLAGWAGVGVLVAKGDLRQAVYWSLSALYVLTATKLQARLRAGSLGKLTVMTGFIVWAMCLLMHPWVVHSREYADVASHVWNMQKGMISIGLLLLLLEEQVDENRWLAQHDELTGLPNRRSFERTFERALEEAQRSRSAVALVLLDLNGFKAVNDTLGHQVGDLLLSGVAKNLGRMMSETAVAARLGGDEFVVSARLTEGRRSVYDVLAEVRALIDRPIACGDQEISVKASLGFAVYPEDARLAHELLKLADQRMYVLKGKRVNADRSVAVVSERFKLTLPEPWQRTVESRSGGSGRGERSNRL